MQKKIKFLIVFYAVIFGVSCVTSDETSQWDYNYELDEGSNVPLNSKDSDDTPFSYAKVKKFISGDTILLQSNKIVKYAGIQSPFEGEAYFETAKAFNQHLIGYKMLKLIWVVGTKASENIWYANVITKVAPLPQGISVVEQLVKNGYAKVVTSKPIEYETLDDNGKKIILTPEQNNLIYNKLISLQDEAKRNKLGIWSSKYEK